MQITKHYAEFYDCLQKIHYFLLLLLLKNFINDRNYLCYKSCGKFLVFFGLLQKVYLFAQDAKQEPNNNKILTYQ